MANNEFDEVQKQPEVKDRGTDSDPLADFRLARPEGAAVTEKSDADVFGSLDMTQDDPLAKKAVDDAMALLDKSSDVRGQVKTDGATDEEKAAKRSENLQSNLDSFNKMTPEQREAELTRWQQYVSSLDNAAKVVDRAYGVT